jgi:hypothetical protein
MEQWAIDVPILQALFWRTQVLNSVRIGVHILPIMQIRATGYS